MELTIKRRGLTPLRFWKADGRDGYIFVDDSIDGRYPGTLGRQITKNSGSCISSSDEDFVRVCRNWWQRKRRELDLRYDRELNSNWR